MRSAVSDIERFDIVKDVDAQLQRHLDYCPSLKPSSEPYPANISIDDDYDYLPCARYTFVLRLAGMRIQLYGRFYTRSYRDFRFQEARQVRHALQRPRPRSRLTFAYRIVLPQPGLPCKSCVSLSPSFIEPLGESIWPQIGQC